MARGRVQIKAGSARSCAADRSAGDSPQRRTELGRQEHKKHKRHKRSCVFCASCVLPAWKLIEQHCSRNSCVEVTQAKLFFRFLSGNATNNVVPANPDADSANNVVRSLPARDSRQQRCSLTSCTEFTPTTLFVRFLHGIHDHQRWLFASCTEFTPPTLVARFLRGILDTNVGCSLPARNSHHQRWSLASCTEFTHQRCSLASCPEFTTNNVVCSLPASDSHQQRCSLVSCAEFIQTTLFAHVLRSRPDKLSMCKKTLA